jgi:hypothetical protein
MSFIPQYSCVKKCLVMDQISIEIRKVKISITIFIKHSESKKLSMNLSYLSQSIFHIIPVPGNVTSYTHTHRFNGQISLRGTWFNKDHQVL